MTPKIISWVQPNFQQGPKDSNAFYLPYSAGVIWAYCKKHEDIDRQFQLGHLIWRRDPISATAAKLADSDIVAFSTYVWNHNYNYNLAQQVKQLNPNCLIVFGGPEPAITDPDLFKKNPFMDIVIKLEGEITFVKLLRAFEHGNYDHISGLVINKQGHTHITGEPERISNLDQIPSPYLTGVFDKIIAETQGVEWNATLETNRGCPYACTFCDWGSLTYNKVKKFNLERVFAELEWIGKNKCGFLSITDANFGMFVERDNLIVDKLLEVQEKYGYPYTLNVAWAKNQKAEVVDIVKKLINSPKSNQGLTVSVQSMDLDVLENIKRRNLEQHKIEEIFALCDKHSIPVYTEIILGLPGETLETWRSGFYKLFRANNHVGITILHAQMLENAEMNLLQKKLYKIKHRPVYDYMSGSYNFDELKESVEVVISTKDMSTDDMLEAHAISWFLNTFHINGLTTYISRFLHKNKGIDYKEFYDKLYEFVKQDEWFKKERSHIKKYYRNWMLEGSINHPDIRNIEVHGWNLVHRTILNMHSEKKYSYIFDLIEKFVKNNFDIEEADQLLEFNKLFVIDYDKIKSYPLVKKFDYDFLGYIQDDLDLKSSTEYKFDFLEDKNISLERFLENIYFSRRRNFGKAWITKLTQKEYVDA
jgi:tRNA A37 methylthiotransferase MiaB